MCEKIAELYQVSPDTRALMNCYIIKTANEKLVVIDGGGKHYLDDSSSGYLYEKLKEISGKDIPEIEAWFLTHMHDDHVTEFYLIGQNKSLPITVKNVYFNFPPKDYFETAEEGRSAFLYDKVAMAYDRFFGEGAFEKCGGKTAAAGDVFTVDGLKIEILLTYYDKGISEVINDTSMVFRITAGEQKILFLGDSYYNQGERLIRKFGADAKSDIVQMAHHGQNGVTEDVYRAISPLLCLWPSPDWVFDNWNRNLRTFETREWMMKIGVKYHLITGRYKTQSISLPVCFDSLPEEDISVKAE